VVTRFLSTHRPHPHRAYAAKKDFKFCLSFHNVLSNSTQIVIAGKSKPYDISKLAVFFGKYHFKKVKNTRLLGKDKT
jgi:hypothetical protein